MKVTKRKPRQYGYALGFSGKGVVDEFLNRALEETLIRHQEKLLYALEKEKVLPLEAQAFFKEETEYGFTIGVKITGVSYLRPWPYAWYAIKEAIRLTFTAK